MRWKKWLRWAGIGVLAGIAGLAVFVQVQQHILRWRAERLLADIRAIQMGKSTWADAQRLVKHWDQWSTSSVPCSEASCTCWIEVQDTLWTLGSAYDKYRSVWGMLAIPYLLLGGRQAMAVASLNVVGGHVTESTFELFLIVVPSKSNGWNGYGLVGSASEYAEFAPYDFEDQRLLHPEYWIGKPGGCEGCIKLMTGFTRFADRAKVDELTSFSFSCITRWRPCTTEADLMPLAWKQHAEEMPKVKQNRDAFQHCAVPLSFFGYESNGIAVADVLARAVDRAPDIPGLGVQLRIVRVLKGRIDWQINKPQIAFAYDRGEAIGGWSAADLVPGRRYILFGGFGTERSGQGVLGLDDCGVVPFTEQSLAAVEDGVRRSIALKNPAN